MVTNTGRATLPEFSGLPQENPGEFLRQCEVRLARAEIPPDEWAERASEQLRDVVRHWWSLWGQFGMLWPEFTTKFMQRFDTGEAVVQCTSQFYGRQQRDGESVEQFVAHKLQLFRRIMPNTEPTAALPTVTTLLRDELQPFLRCYRHTSVEDYVQQAVAT
ncbi:activity-regulated cytoskeleton-associated protein-like [Bacillus rossius redtenbacheri]|uniref:activity-regulated cytoskeleton-associated protein-like n=1 Tax=Bacillus rossius redtenbacheri TaxID=93214 RepID=UPI002FDD3B9C